MAALGMLLLFACDGGFLDVDDLTLARDAYTERNLPLAERLLERCLRQEENPEKRWEAWNLLLKAINGDRPHPRASLECLDAMLVEYEDDPAKMAEILPEIGRYCRLSRSFERAVEAWSAYIELPELDSSQRINGYRQLAAMQFAQKHYEAAEESLQQCLGLSAPEEDKTACMLDLAEENMMLERWPDVANLCQQILETQPDREIYGKAAYLRADALEQMGQMEEALRLFEAAKDSYPNPLVMENRIAHLKKKTEK